MKTSAARTSRALTLALALLPLPLAAGTPAEESLGLAEAAERALAHNPDLAVDLPGLEAARLRYEAARAGYLPRVDFEYAYEAGDNPVFVFSTLL
ncbi:MAG: TolC family protein, partial [Acidobacteria bacterium]|nr:TolC family protein [Acidobacteriota bacterium]